MKRRTLFDGLAFGALAAVLGLGMFFGEQLVTKHYASEVRVGVRRDLGELRHRVEENLNGDLQLVKGLLSVIAVNPRIDQPTLETALRPIFAGRTNLRNVAVAPDMVIRLMYPLQGNERALGLEYRTTPQFEMADKARTTRQIVLAGPLELVQGGKGLVARLPVFHPGQNGAPEHFWGLVSAVIDIDKLFVSSGLRNDDLAVEVALRGIDGRGAEGGVFMGRPEVFESDPVLADIKLPYGSWQMAAIPKGGWAAHRYNVWPLRAGFALVAILLLGALRAFRRAS
jgi:sensor domain CHASE-containing protein